MSSYLCEFTICIVLLDWREAVLAYAAYRANPIFRQIFERCARLNLIARIAFCRVIRKTA